MSAIDAVDGSSSGTRVPLMRYLHLDAINDIGSQELL
jgi:hypothetical protein